jgi:hypothetical protein
MGTWSIFTTIMAKKAKQVEGFISGAKPPEPVDRNLPLGLYVGASVDLDATPFILGGPALKIQLPGERNTVEAFGRINFASNILYRFYLKSLPGDQESMLQIAVNKDGDIEECRLFRSFDQVYPRLVDEWAFWLDEREGYIGWPVFETKDDQTQYARVWAASDPNHVPGFKFSETIVMDRYGRQVETVNHTAMLYGRQINETHQIVEYMLVGAETHGSDQALINVLVGIDMMPLVLKVI